ncbi:hypothetical protein Y1Q_0005935 [Alligator mississippiensis]|uniref:Uncharacterized protein n=1 Tax=Alligator mississippiensis TaxID=8496 RepID=A0A151P6H9_ALLMI|nr:hypothetical protein Y1Q_0005935 [Alligator mississippiensis]
MVPFDVLLAKEQQGFKEKYKFPLTTSPGGNKQHASTKDMITDFAEKHDEYLIFLQQRNRSELKSTKRNDSLPPVQIEELELLGCSAQTASSKIQRKGWLQKTLQIRTESGSRLCIEPPSEYSDNFELYESLNMERNDDHPVVYVQNIKSPSSRSPSDIRFSNLNSDLQVSSGVEKERILLSIDDVKVH